mgnify:CR=1 FL=1
MFSLAETNKEDRINVVSRGDDGLPLRDTPLSLRDTPLSLRDIPPFRGNFFFVSPNRGDVGCADRGVHAERSAAAHHLSLRDIPRVVEKSVNSVSAFGAKSSVHFLLPEGNPLGGLFLSPPNPIAQPSAALLRYGCGIPLAGTLLGFGGDPWDSFPPEMRL